ncbi:MAG: DUF4147 domain-containing protein [Trueperaceae bacterium]|nr:DUF4147 domain-containing protein [Trueperaceae bacterium]
MSDAWFAGDDARRALLTRAFEAAVAASDPVTVLQDAWPPPPAGTVRVLALGKAAATMAAAAEAHYGARGVRVDGLAVVPYGHGAPTRWVEVREAGHPEPDAAGEAAGRALLRRAEGAGARDLVLVLVSGGGSALTTVPDGVDAQEWAEAHRALLASGADVREINAVRRRLDGVKGGRLAVAAHPAEVVALVVSDVVGDDPRHVASGPTVADEAGPEAALAVLDRYRIDAPGARQALQAERAGRRPGPPRPGDPRLARCRTRVVASAAGALTAAAATFTDAGLAARVVTAEVTGDARRAGRVHARLARRTSRRLRGAEQGCVLLSGGETTVRVRGAGRGGRNSTFALALALALRDDLPVWALAADSDGVDGVGGHAGAFVRPGMFAGTARARAEAADARDDSYVAFEQVGALFRTGPTRTNVNDLRFVWVDPPPAGDGRRARG